MPELCDIISFYCTPTEPILADWTIFLDEDEDGNLDVGEQSTTTDSTGDYAFNDLQPGTYTVCEVQQAGWNQTYPLNEGGNCHQVSVSQQPNQGDTCGFLPSQPQDSVQSIPFASTCNFGNQQEVSISKTDNHVTAQPGETLTYEVTVTNPHSVTAFGIKVDDTLPAFIGDPTDISDGGVLSSGHIVWNFLEIPGNSSKTLTYKATVNSSMPVGTSLLHNVADLTCSPFIDLAVQLESVQIDQLECQYAGQATDNTSVTVTPPPPPPVVVVPPPTPAAPAPQVLGISAEADLAITKKVNHGTAKIGDKLTYTIVVSNTGDADATNVVVTDNLPNGFVFLAGGKATRMWNLGTLAAGASKTLTYKTLVTTDATSGKYVNRAFVTADFFDPIQAQATVTVKNPQVLGLATTGAGLRDLITFILGLGLMSAGFVSVRQLRRRSSTTV